MQPTCSPSSSCSASSSCSSCCCCFWRLGLGAPSSPPCGRHNRTLGAQPAATLQPSARAWHGASQRFYSLPPPFQVRYQKKAALACSTELPHLLPRRLLQLEVAVGGPPRRLHQVALAWNEGGRRAGAPGVRVGCHAPRPAEARGRGSSRAAGNPDNAARPRQQHRRRAGSPRCSPCFFSLVLEMRISWRSNSSIWKMRLGTCTACKARKRGQALHRAQLRETCAHTREQRGGHGGATGAGARQWRRASTHCPARTFLDSRLARLAAAFCFLAACLAAFSPATAGTTRERLQAGDRRPGADWLGPQTAPLVDAMPAADPPPPCCRRRWPGRMAVPHHHRPRWPHRSPLPPPPCAPPVQPPGGRQVGGQAWDRTSRLASTGNE